MSTLVWVLIAVVIMFAVAGDTEEEKPGSTPDDGGPGAQE